MKSFLLALNIVALLSFSACGGGGSMTTPPPPATFTIGGTVSGASGSGLILQDNGGNALTIAANGPFFFATQLASGSSYSVTVSASPAGQTCTPSNNTGVVGNANVTTVVITCVGAATFSIGGTVSGASGPGLTLQDNGGDTLTISTNGPFFFATQLASGSSYNVTVFAQPAGQICTPSNNTGVVGNANVTSVVITCTTSSTFTIGGTVSGLLGTGLVLQDNGGDNLSIAGNGSFTFATAIASGSSYKVTVLTQPSGPTQTCSVTNGTGTANANVTNVQVACSTATFTIGGTVSSLSGTGLVLQDNGGDNLSIAGNGSFTFATAVASGSTYKVTVLTQPSGPAQTCSVTNGTGTANANVTNVQVACTTSSGPRPLGTVSAVSSVSCSGAIKNGVCQQMTVSCPGVPDIFAYVKTNTPAGTSKGTVTYAVGTDGNGLYESIYTFGSTAVGNVVTAGFTTVQISWGTPFNNNQPGGWVQGPGGVLAAACRYATVTQWIYDNIQKDTTIPMCATGNSGGAGALGYAMSQYGSGNVLSMAEITSGPMTARLDWGCGCTAGKMTAPVPCGSSSSLGTCFGAADSPVWDPAYTPNTYCSDAAVKGILPPGGLGFFLDDSAEAPGVVYNFPKTNVNVVFGGSDTSSAIPIAMDWYNNITSKKTQGCVVGGMHSLASTSAGATQIANDLINMCKLQ